MRHAAAKAAGAVVAGMLLTCGAVVPAEAGGTLRWEECADLESQRVRVECAELRVPMARGEGADRTATVTLALSRVPASGHRRGTLLVNPGGPGSPGRDWAAVVAERLPEELRSSYDVVGFDPRGTGASIPGVVCDPGYFVPVRPDTVPADGRAEQVLLDRAADYARACAEHTGELLDHMTTVDTADDMEDIRRALGVRRIDYLGYSYGTYLGAVYATRYPDRVRRLVLDSMVNPDLPWYEGNLAQSRALDAAARNFFDWTARHDGVYGLGTTGAQVAEHYYATREALAEEPAAGTVGPTEFEGVFLLAAYTSAYWPSLARTLSAHVVDGDPAALPAAYERFGEDVGTDPVFGGYLATECTDAPWPVDWETWREDAVKTHTEAPFIAWNNIWYNAPCRFWAGSARSWFEVDGTAVDSALLVHATEDGPTPLAGAYAMRARFPNARLVVEDGGVDHGVALSGNPCVDRALAAYLRDGTLPQAGGGADGADLTCVPLPPPEPHSPAGGSGPDTAPLRGA
ncbi:alpha/beta fold hydrolase [Thermobifida halotolerans]|uniref:Alpha/beta fold hydrolase n=1 Tax=Thermobifida halotolerans TaxID=483545 RepID=A0AA97LX25_9ACTN|nr:alpha/beta hydrolase [Thermobifida halotolerans]UOE19842.1 alpha/beta fold hydrolase [Thermobifida halotolerans]